MSTQGIRHLDCRNYAPVDVVRGICHRTKDPVMADEVTCGEWEMLPKCKFCDHFAAGADPNLGACRAEAGREFMAYPEMAAVQCRWFASAPEPRKKSR